MYKFNDGKLIANQNFEATVSRLGPSSEEMLCCHFVKSLHAPEQFYLYHFAVGPSPLF